MNSEGSTPSSSDWPSRGGSLVLAWFSWGCSTIGGAPALQAGGYGFEPRLLHDLSVNIPRGWLNVRKEGEQYGSQAGSGSFGKGLLCWQH